MTQDPQRQRQRKRLLVASVGVATVSFMALQTGCEDPDGLPYAANLLAIPLDGSIDFATVADAASDAQLDARPPTLPTSGNLVAIPYDAGLKDAASDALISSGNLVAPPPPDAAADAASDGATDASSDAALKDGSAPKDARVDTGIPSSGNLLPPLGPR